MSRSTVHKLQPTTDHDGLSRRLAVLASKLAIHAQLQPALESDYQEDQAHVEQADSYRLWSGFTRASQDRMWQLLAGQIDHDYQRIAHSAAEATECPTGSLTLGELDAVPAYQTRATIHGQPGGYMLDRDADDLAAGILYEAGGNIYAMGQGIGKKDSKGERMIAFIRDQYPDFSPHRILEMGCSAGSQSTDYPAAFPDSQFHAIDLSPAMLKYAHARAEVLGSNVHFHQQDAGATKFPDQYFDLIVSHNMFHEVEASYMSSIAGESFRLLAPGGICIHQDVPIQLDRLEEFQAFTSSWQKDHNDEPFWLDFANADLPALLISAGFPVERVGSQYLQAIDGPIPWYVVIATK